MEFKNTKEKVFYVLVIVLTVSINLAGIIAGKYIGMNLGFMRNLIFWIAVLIIAYIVKLFFWFVLHRKFQLSFIYPFLSLSYFFSLILGKVLFQEAITTQKIIGTIIIASGIFFIMMSGKKLEST
jgi:drug/metabolite transporter (DMT)-like permease